MHYSIAADPARRHRSETIAPVAGYAADWHATAAPTTLPRKRLCAKRLVRCGWWLLGLLMLGCLPMAILRSVHDMGGTDFPEYYAAGRHLLEHGKIQPLAMTAYYLPSLDVMWAGVALFPLPVAALLWYALGCAAWFCTLRALDRYFLCEAPAEVRAVTVVSVGLLVSPLVLDQLCLGAFHGLMLWWTIAGLGRIVRGHRWSGAALLGLGIWIKLLPALGVLYLLLKRRWREAIAAGAVAAAVDLALCSICFTWQENWQAHVEWLRRDAAGTASLLLDSPAKINEQRVTNQSLPAVLRRTLTRLGYPSATSRDFASLANLSSAQLRAVYYGIVGVLAICIAWYCRRSAARTPAADQATEVALVILSTLWFTPIAPSYHPMAVAPALALILARHPYQRLAWGAVALWTLALTLHGVPHARSFGHMLWATLLLGGMLLFPYVSRPATADERGSTA